MAVLPGSNRATETKPGKAVPHQFPRQPAPNPRPLHAPPLQKRPARRYRLARTSWLGMLRRFRHQRDIVNPGCSLNFVLELVAEEANQTYLHFLYIFSQGPRYFDVGPRLATMKLRCHGHRNVLRSERAQLESDALIRSDCLSLHPRRKTV